MAVTGARDAAELAMTQRKQSVTDLYQRHAADADQLVYLLTEEKHLAEDLAQDAFVRVFGRFQELRKPEAFAFYLWRTIVNLSRDHFYRMDNTVPTANFPTSLAPSLTCDLTLKIAAAARSGRARLFCR